MTMILSRGVAVETTLWEYNPLAVPMLISFGGVIATLQSGINMFRAVRSTTAKSTGRWYFELNIQSHTNINGGWVGGVGLDTTGLLQRLGSDTDGSLGFSADVSPANSAAVWENGDFITYYTFNWGIEDRFGFAVDLIDHALWARNVTLGLGWTRSVSPWGLGGLTTNPSTGFPVPASVPIYIMWSAAQGAVTGTSRVILVTAPGSLARGSPPENFFWWDHGPHHI